MFFYLLLIFFVYAVVIYQDTLRSMTISSPVHTSRYRSPYTGEFLPEYSFINDFYTQVPSARHPWVPQAPVTPASPASPR